MQAEGQHPSPDPTSLRPWFGLFLRVVSWSLNMGPKKDYFRLRRKGPYLGPMKLPSWGFMGLGFSGFTGLRFTEKGPQTYLKSAPGFRWYPDSLVGTS